MELQGIKVIIGLGNPGPKFKKTRHNIGFMIVDALADRAHGTWQQKNEYEVAEVTLNNHHLMLVKPLTFMNDSGKVLSSFTKKGITPEQMLVVHDELEKPLGTVQMRLGGTARGHNGLRSIIGTIGEQFYRLRFGIGRPARKEDVADWVLSNFEVDDITLKEYINKAVDILLNT